MKKSSFNQLEYWIILCLAFLPISPKAQINTSFIDKALNDSLKSLNNRYSKDSIHTDNKINKELKLNENAIKMIQFDFSPSHKEQAKPHPAPMDKPWMEYQVDLAIPKNLIDTVKVRKSKNPRLLPYTIWTKFGENPVYDVLVFGKKKELKISWTLDLYFEENYGRSLMPIPKSMIPSGPANSSVVIKNLDFMGFIYDNFTKQGRIRKHNQKYATAWKTYKDAGPVFNPSSTSEEGNIDTLKGMNRDDATLGKRYASILLLEEENPLYVEKPDHKLLQSAELRSRFGTFYDPILYAFPHTDSISDNGKQDKPTRKSKKKKRKKQTKASHEQEKEDDMKELPNSMADLYKYIQMKKEQDSLKRAEFFRSDKVNENAFELGEQRRKLKEQRN